MGPLNIVLWLAGVALIAIGYTRARGPWARYQALKAQDANVARYEAWRGGVRDDGTTGASVAMADPPPPGADRRARSRSSGVVLVFLGFLDPLTPGRRRPPAPSRPSRRADPPPLDRGAAVHHDLEAAVVGDPGRLPVDDAELEPQARAPRRRPPRRRAARTARTAGRRRRCRTGRSRRPPRRASR